MVKIETRQPGLKEWSPRRGESGALTAARPFESEKGLVGSPPETRQPLLSVAELAHSTLHFFSLSPLRRSSRS
eukprot:1910962-Pleurochrysis_carterae.AAC.1